MKSKSLELLKKEHSVENNKTFDFVSLYKTAADTNVKLLENDKLGQKLKEKKIKSDCENRPHKNKKKSKSKSDDISPNIDTSENVSKSSHNEISKITSSPNNGEKKKSAVDIKSIIKSSDDSMNIPEASLSDSKPKKRNKTVSFVLDDNEETAVKKTKSDNSADNNNTVQSINKNKKNKLKKINKRHLGEKENDDEAYHPKLDNTSDENIKKFSEKHSITSESGKTHADLELSKFLVKKKANKKFKKHQKETGNSEDENKITGAQSEGQNEQVQVSKKNKKKKHSLKATQVPDETEGEPVTKSRKKDVKPEIIAEDLENLNIGDNTHTLTNLLDEMTVVDKKKKKNTGKQKKGKHSKVANTSNNDSNFENSVEIKEREKWRKRKWNKDKKGVLNVDQVLCSVMVENLPLNVMLSYKKLLAEHFSKCGIVKKIGIVEVYPTEDPKPVFTTTVFFDSEDAVSKALEEDNTSFEGNFIRVKRPLPPTKTTLVVRSYGELTEQALSSVFSGAGRIRNIRHLVKGKKSMATAFIEFDGPRAVERAIKMAEEAKIGGKKVHVSKFQLRKENRDKKIKHNTKNENTEKSDDSSD